MTLSRVLLVCFFLLPDTVDTTLLYYVRIVLSTCFMHGFQMIETLYGRSVESGKAIIIDNVAQVRCYSCVYTQSIIL